MAKFRGIVAEVRGRSCILLTPEGEFVRIPRLPRPLEVGQELEVARTSLPWYKSGLVAAVLLLALLIPLYPMYTAMAQPAAYVSLDINPSLELGINKAGVVVTTQSFNQDGKKLLQATPVKKADVYQAVQALLERAVAEGYVTEAKQNLIVAAYSGDYPVDPGKLQDIIRQEAEKAKAPLQYIVLPSTIEVHKQAEANRVSQGKYLMYQASASSGKDLSLEDLKKNGINKALGDKGLKVEDLEPGVSHYRPEDQATPADQKDQDHPDKSRKPEQKRQEQDKGQTNKPQGENKTDSDMRGQGNHNEGRSRSAEKEKHL